MILATQTKYIKYLSYAYHGTSHDLSILRTELPREKGLWFSEHAVHLDLGYLGINKDYKFGQICIPFRKSKNIDLTEEQKMTN